MYVTSPLHQVLTATATYDSLQMFSKKCNMKLTCIKTAVAMVILLCSHINCLSQGTYEIDLYAVTFTAEIPEVKVDQLLLREIHNFIFSDKTDKQAQRLKANHQDDDSHYIMVSCRVYNDSICEIYFNIDGIRDCISAGFTKYNGWLYWFNDMLPDGLMLGYSASPQVTRRFFVDNNKANYLTSHKFVYNYKKCKITSKWYREKRIY